MIDQLKVINKMEACESQKKTMKTAQDYHGGGNGKIFDNMVLQDSKHAPLIQNSAHWRRLVIYNYRDNWWRLLEVFS